MSGFLTSVCTSGKPLTRGPSGPRKGRTTRLSALAGVKDIPATDDKAQTHDTDVVVIGAGIGGLSCAAILAKYGLDVTVLESHDVVGGAAHVRLSLLDLPDLHVNVGVPLGVSCLSVTSEPLHGRGKQLFASHDSPSAHLVQASTSHGAVAQTRNLRYFVSVDSNFGPVHVVAVQISPVTVHIMEQCGTTGHGALESSSM